VVPVCVARTQPYRQFAEWHGISSPLLVDSDATRATRVGIAIIPTAVLIQAGDIVARIAISAPRMTRRRCSRSSWHRCPACLNGCQAQYDEARQ
jgi:ABC-type enterobactin transport system permease subunit